MKSESVISRIFILSVIPFMSLLFMNFKSEKIRLQRFSDENYHSELELFGEEIFKRENCVACHTLNIENETDSNKSLDGYGGLRSNSWLYEFLIDPPTLIPNCNMPSFNELNRAPINKSDFEKLFLKNGFAQTDLEKSWSNLMYESNLISKELKEQNANYVPNSEINALIAFIQKIPSSKQKLVRDSISNSLLTNEILVWDEAYKNYDSLNTELSPLAQSEIKGKKLFQENCAACHGRKAQGEIGPNLTDNYWIYGGTKQKISASILNGTQKGMPNHKYRLKPEEVNQLLAYLLSIKGTNIEGGKSPQGKKE